ncbi:hypothetical protein LIA77_00200 [Sarocladium implicatum]|nr:hypothetical protein LIA77_00200 [Sarocladium implicatum]
MHSTAQAHTTAQHMTLGACAAMDHGVDIDAGRWTLIHSLAAHMQGVISNSRWAQFTVRTLSGTIWNSRLDTRSSACWYDSFESPLTLHVDERSALGALLHLLEGHATWRCKPISSSSPVIRIEFLRVKRKPQNGEAINLTEAAPLERYHDCRTICSDFSKPRITYADVGGAVETVSSTHTSFLSMKDLLTASQAEPNRPPTQEHINRGETVGGLYSYE